MLEEFLNHHPGLALPLLGLILMLNARFDVAIGIFRRFAFVTWFLGGMMVGVSLLCYVWGYALFLGPIRPLIALTVFVSAMWALVRFRPKENGVEEPGQESVRK